MRQQQRPRSMLDDARDGFNLLTFVTSVHQKTIIVFTRWGMGAWGMGETGVWALGLIVMYGLTMNSRAMIFLYAPAFLAASILQKAFPDKRQHSRYTGYPWFFDGIITNEYLARFLEAASMLFVGNVLYAFDPALGLFVQAGAGSLGFHAVIGYTLHRRRVVASGDWQAEADAWQRAMEEAKRRLR